MNMNQTIYQEFYWYVQDGENFAVVEKKDKGILMESVKENGEEHIAVTSSLDIPKGSNEEIWAYFSSLGLHVFTWGPNGGGYNKVKSPTKKISSELARRIEQIKGLYIAPMDFNQIDELKINEKKM